MPNRQKKIEKTELRKYGERRDEKNNTGDTFDLRTRPLAVKYTKSKKTSVFKTRIVEEFTPAGIKKYSENYESKHFKLKETVNNGERNCDEKYEGSQYGFKESTPYEMPMEGGYQGPNRTKLRHNFPMRLNFSDDGDHDESSISLMDTLPASLRVCEKMIYTPKKNLRKKSRDEVKKKEQLEYSLRNSISNGLKLCQKGEEGEGYKLKNEVPEGLKEGRRSEDSQHDELKNIPRGRLRDIERREDLKENGIKNKPEEGLKEDKAEGELSDDQNISHLSNTTTKDTPQDMPGNVEIDHPTDASTTLTLSTTKDSNEIDNPTEVSTKLTLPTMKDSNEIGEPNDGSTTPTLLTTKDSNEIDQPTDTSTGLTHPTTKDSKEIHQPTDTSTGLTHPTTKDNIKEIDRSDENGTKYKYPTMTDLTGGAKASNTTPHNNDKATTSTEKKVESTNNSRRDNYPDKLKGNEEKDTIPNTETYLIGPASNNEQRTKNLYPFASAVSDSRVVSRIDDKKDKSLNIGTEDTHLDVLKEHDKNNVEEDAAGNAETPNDLTESEKKDENPSGSGKHAQPDVGKPDPKDAIDHAMSKYLHQKESGSEKNNHSASASWKYTDPKEKESEEMDQKSNTTLKHPSPHFNVYESESAGTDAESNDSSHITLEEETMEKPAPTISSIDKYPVIEEPEKLKYEHEREDQGGHGASKGRYQNRLSDYARGERRKGEAPRDRYRPRVNDYGEDTNQAKCAQPEDKHSHRINAYEKQEKDQDGRYEEPTGKYRHRLNDCKKEHGEEKDTYGFEESTNDYHHMLNDYHKEHKGEENTKKCEPPRDHYDSRLDDYEKHHEEDEREQRYEESIERHPDGLADYEGRENVEAETVEGGLEKGKLEDEFGESTNDSEPESPSNGLEDAEKAKDKAEESQTKLNVLSTNKEQTKGADSKRGTSYKKNSKGESGSSKESSAEKSHKKVHTRSSNSSSNKRDQNNKNNDKKKTKTRKKRRIEKTTKRRKEEATYLRKNGKRNHGEKKALYVQDNSQLKNYEEGTPRRDDLDSEVLERNRQQSENKDTRKGGKRKTKKTDTSKNTNPYKRRKKYNNRKTRKSEIARAVKYLSDCADFDESAEGGLKKQKSSNKNSNNKESGSKQNDKSDYAEGKKKSSSSREKFKMDDIEISL
ncbi:hypothetical protein C922_02878 [Plasmodium inui San Antonio 1]|uniref:EMP3/KAHRP N-terminal domain-containing protein n=1 Tax=Plasmodium inui San Antonio 1 TaxID=1237626 RepID=W7A106_9APIC|nr:hypothetical protein C922_02878 [Plasmodium inui San Antonio 1]EUD66892.1 hypothetical protein C922_02878 [Plasmodium inui San Antonio 1]